MKLEDFHYFITLPGQSTALGARGQLGAGTGNPLTAKNDKSGATAEGVSIGKPWLVFLHGLLGSAANWRRITPAFEDRFRILTYDQRGHGRSVKPPTGYDPVDFAGDLYFILDQLSINKIDLVGHSMGGRNAFAFAAKYPEKVRKLVIEDIGPEASEENGGGLIELLKGVPVPFKDKMKAKEYLLNEFGDPKLGSYLYTNIKVLPDQRATWSFDLAAIVEIVQKGRGQHRWQEIEALKCPTLLLRGEHSTELGRAEYNEMLARNSHLTGLEIAGAGHWIHSDQPDKFIGVVRDFLEE